MYNNAEYNAYSNYVTNMLYMYINIDLSNIPLFVYIHPLIRMIISLSIFNSQFEYTC